MPRGVEIRVPLKAALDAHRAHQAGWSMRALARMHYAEWGYASPSSALEGLRGAWRVLELQARDRIEATVEASTVHGNSSRAARDPEHPGHAAFLAQRRHLRARKREAA